MMTFIFMGVLSAVAILAVLMRLGIKRFIRFPAILDVSASVLLAVIYSGTFGGMAAAIAGGLAFTGMVSLLRLYYGMSGTVRADAILLHRRTSSWLTRLKHIA